MHKFDKTVPFDPGFSKISFSFIENIEVAEIEYSRLKANHQRKFWLAKNEQTIVEFIEKSSAFYLGCMLWGGYIHCRFKDSPKLIEGNNIEKRSEEELKDFDCAVEAKAMLEYIKRLNRDCKYILNRAAKISPQIAVVLENYVQFASLNINFISITSTEQIKLPELVKSFEELSPEKLDAICEKVYACIDSGKIESLLGINY